MKIVRWTELDNPQIVSAFGEGITIEDSPYWWNLQVGDMIQHASDGLGTGCYFVTKVEEPEPNTYPRGIKLVTIKGAV